MANTTIEGLWTFITGERIATVMVLRFSILQTNNKQTIKQKNNKQSKQTGERIANVMVLRFSILSKAPTILILRFLFLFYLVRNHHSNQSDTSNILGLHS